MQKSLLFTFVILIAIGVAAYMWWPVVRPAETPTEESGRIMSIETYVSQNISDLSPAKEQVGGKFFVTEITAADGKGVVSYEDGHNAYTADFTYTTSETGHQITSFVIRN